MPEKKTSQFRRLYDKTGWVGRLLLLSAAVTFTLGYVTIPIIAWVSITSSLNSLYQVAMLEAVDSVRYGVMSRVAEAQSIAVVIENLLAQGLLPTNASGDALLVTLLLGHPQLSTVYYNYANGLYSAASTIPCVGNYGPPTIQIESPLTTGGEYYIYNYSTTTHQRLPTLECDAGPFNATGRPWFLNRVTLYRDFSSGLLTFTVSHPYMDPTNPNFQLGVGAVDVQGIGLQDFLVSLVPIAGANAGRSILMSDIGEFIVSERTLVFDYLAVDASGTPLCQNSSGQLTIVTLDCLPVSDNGVLAAGIRAVLETADGIVENLADEVLISTSKLIVTMKRVVVPNLVPAGPNWIAITVLPLDEVYPSFIQPVISTVLIYVFGIAAIVFGIGGIRYYVWTYSRTPSPNSWSKKIVLSNSQAVSVMTTATLSISSIVSVLMCFGVYIAWTNMDIDDMKLPVVVLANQTTLHVADVFNGALDNVRATYDYLQFLTSTDVIPIQDLVYDAVTHAEVEAMRAAEIGMYLIGLSLALSVPSVQQVSVSTEENLLLGVRVEGDSVLLVVVDSTTRGHLTTFSFLPDGTRNVSSAIESEIFEVSHEEWFETALHGNGTITWSEVHPVPYTSQLAATLSGVSHLEEHEATEVVLAMDFTVPTAKYLLGLAQVEETFGTAFISQNDILELSMIASTTKDSQYRFDDNGVPHLVLAEKSVEEIVVLAAEQLKLFEEHGTEIPRVSDVGVGTAQYALVFSHITDSYGLDWVLCVEYLYSNFLAQLFDWHSLSVGVIVGVVGTVCFSVVWAVTYLNSIVKVLSSEDIEVELQTQKSMRSMRHLVQGPSVPQNAQANRKPPTTFADTHLRTLESDLITLLEPEELSEEESCHAFGGMWSLLVYARECLGSSNVASPFLTSSSADPAAWAGSGTGRDDVSAMLTYRVRQLLPAARAALEEAKKENPSSELGKRASRMLSMKALGPADSGEDPAYSLATFEAARVMFVRTIKGYNVGKDVFFDALQQSGFLLFWHRTVNNPLFSYWMIFICVSHHLLTFVEGGNLSEWHHGSPGLFHFCMISNLVIILWYVFFTVSYNYWTRKLKGYFNLKGAIYIFLTVVMGVDMIVMWIVHYETGTIYIKYPLPVTSIVRPFMLIMMFPSLRRSAWDFMKTMYYSRAVLALAVVFIAIGTATSVALFRHEIAQHAVSLSDGYDTFQTGFITMLVFILTGENYAHTVYAYIGVNKSWIGYFFIISMAGTFFLIALLVANFQIQYGKLHEESASELAAKSRTRNRQGFLAIYTLLAVCMGHAVEGSPVPQLRWGTIRRFLFTFCGLPDTQALDSAKNSQRHASFKSDLRRASHILRHSSRCTPKVVEEVERLLLRCTISHSSLPPVLTGLGSTEAYVRKAHLPSDTLVGPNDFLHQCDALAASENSASFLAIASGKVMPDFRNNEAFASFIDTMTGGVPVKKRHGVYTILFERVEAVLVFAHLWVLLLYGSTLSTSMVPFLIAVYCAYILELLFRLWHQGWVKFWYPMLHSWSATDSLHEKYRVQGNHVETWIAIISLLGLLAFGFMEAAHATVLHTVNHGVFFLALPVVRLLFIGPFKAQMFGLLNAIPDFGSLFAMLALTLYMFGIIGVWNFAGYLSKLSVLEYKIPAATFDSFGVAVESLFQIVVGNRWDEIMEAAIASTSQLYVAFYFIVFVVIFHVLVIDMFIGVVCEAFLKIHEMEHVEAHHTVDAFTVLQKVFIKYRMRKSSFLKSQHK